MCCSNSHTVLFVGCHLTTFVVFPYDFGISTLYSRVVIVFIFFSMHLFFPMNDIRVFGLIRGPGIWFFSMLCGCSFVWSYQEKNSVVKELLSCSQKFRCVVWATENWLRNCFWPVDSSSQRCVDTIKITQVVRLCQLLKSFIPTWKLHHRFSIWFPTWGNSWRSLPSSEVYSSLNGVWWF